MPLQNRVTPFSDLIATRERGTLNGNRGCLHNAQAQICRPFRGERWIICLLKFKDRRHPIMRPGWYTDLFFLDEVTALAAGHRPCAECQRARFNTFRETWAAANPGLAASSRPLATTIDRHLHIERTGRRSVGRSINDLPDGAFVSENGRDAYLVWKKQLLLWTPGGYMAPMTKIAFPITVLTPPSVVNTLNAGYPCGIHASANAEGLSVGPV
jgi:hypothetical protein